MLQGWGLEGSGLGLAEINLVTHFRAITEIYFLKLIIWLLPFLVGSCCWVFFVCLSRSTATTERYSQGYRPYREDFQGN